MKRSWRMKVSEQQLAAFASQVVDDHDVMLGRGFRLMGSSGIWRTKTAGMTARLVYRLRKADGESTRTYTFRNIQP